MLTQHKRFFRNYLLGLKIFLLKDVLCKSFKVVVTDPHIGHKNKEKKKDGDTMLLILEIFAELRDKCSKL